MHQNILSVLLFALCLVFAETQAAGSSTVPDEGTPVGKKLYKWIDREGNVSYRDQPPPEGSGGRVEERPMRYGEDPTRKKGDPNEKAAEKHPVILYSVPKCDTCDLARIYLQKRKVPFTEKNLDNDPDVQDELRKKTGVLSAPTILIGKKVMKGYLESLLEGELDQAGYTQIEEPASDAGSTERKSKPSP